MSNLLSLTIFKDSLSVNRQEVSQLMLLGKRGKLSCSFCKILLVITSYVIDKTDPGNSKQSAKRYLFKQQNTFSYLTYMSIKFNFMG